MIKLSVQDIDEMTESLLRSEYLTRTVFDGYCMFVFFRFQ